MYVDENKNECERMRLEEMKERRNGPMATMAKIIMIMRMKAKKHL